MIDGMNDAINNSLINLEDDQINQIQDQGVVNLG